MRFSIEGIVSPCCFNTYLHDCYPARKIGQIWNGQIFKEYRKNIKANYLPKSCNICETKLNNGEFSLIPIHQFDDFKIDLFKQTKLQTIQLAISNKCNLKCIMCCENFSSQFDNSDTYTSPNLYDKSFYDELFEYIPSLKEVICAGGEPFYDKDYMELMDTIVGINPKCRISIVTNGTILNDRIKRLVENGNFNINLSFDSCHKETYEKIRVNAKFENVISHMKYFGDILKQKGQTLQIPVCSLKENCEEIPELVRFCNDNSYHITIKAVKGITNVAAWDLPSSQLKDLKDFYLQQDFTTHDWCSESNVANFNDYISMVSRWIVDAERKENYQNIFDMKTDKVSELKNILYNNMKQCLKKSSLSENDFRNKQEYIFDKCNRIMKDKPEYFESNHFYNILANISPYQIIEWILRCNSSTIIKILDDGFYYGFRH
jgi:molybdenum cofactor biosynthesis enzyme MoaA